MVCGRYTYILQYRIHIYSIPWGFETETNKHNWGVQPTPSGRWQPPSVGDLTLWMEEIQRVGRWFIPIKSQYLQSFIVTNSCQVVEDFFRNGNIGLINRPSPPPPEGQNSTL